MPTARRSRTISAPLQELWEVVGDPHHLPRWWPRVERVEDVEGDAFTEVMRTAKGKVVRADFQLVPAVQDAHAAQHVHTLRWRQRVAGTPFARLLKSAETEVRLQPVPPPSGAELAAADDAGEAATAATEVTIELRQTLNGFFSRFGGYMVRRAAAATIEEALDGLERIGG
jgi:uncharacterized protein YndB with AHSA1/START domain